jgi:hypothetical protein
VSLPAADDLFRPTSQQRAAGSSPAEPKAESAVRAVPDPPREAERPAAGDAKAARTPSGRIRHDEKMTVYVTSDELLDLEHARLALRRTHGLAVDRGRLVREAVALVLADFEANGGDSALVRRLTEE